jgi:hypothetical protein
MAPSDASPATSIAAAKPPLESGNRYRLVGSEAAQFATA